MTAHAEGVKIGKRIVAADGERDVVVPLEAGPSIDLALTHAATITEVSETPGEVAF